MKRNYGIDLLRIVATYSIFVLHILGWGGVLGTLELGTRRFVLTWTLEMMAFVSVNCYALISGYVGVDSDYKISNVVLILVHTVYHTILITILFMIFSETPVTKSSIIDAFFPVMRNQYWYLNAYVGLFVFIPILNIFVRSYAKYGKLIILALLMVFSVYSTIAVGDIFTTNTGYSALWLIVLYIIGAIIKKSHIDLKNTYLLGLYVLCLAISVVVIGLNGQNDLIFSYQSPVVVVASICMLMIFSKINVAERFTKIIKVISPTTLFLYIIHANPLVWNRLLEKRFLFITSRNTISMLLSVLLFAAAGFLICFILDEIRVLFFRVTGIDNAIKNVCKKVQDKYK